MKQGLLVLLWLVLSTPAHSFDRAIADRANAAREIRGGGQAKTWQGLALAPEDRCSPYDSEDYRYPQSIELKIAERIGGIYSPYTDEVFKSLEETDIEHIVARSEAHDSGLCAASLETRRVFSVDLDNLTLASPYVNRVLKRDKDAADWMPERNRCWFAQTVVKVKRKYSLSVDRRERDALAAVLKECMSLFEILQKIERSGNATPRRH